MKRKLLKRIKNIFEVEVDLSKAEGFYYWVGDATLLFEDRCTYCRFLNDQSLECWLDDFAYKVRQYMQENSYKTFKEAVDALQERINK